MSHENLDPRVPTTHPHQVEHYHHHHPQKKKTNEKANSDTRRKSDLTQISHETTRWDFGTAESKDSKMDLCDQSCWRGGAASTSGTTELLEKKKTQN